MKNLASFFLIITVWWLLEGENGPPVIDEPFATTKECKAEKFFYYNRFHHEDARAMLANPDCFEVNYDSLKEKKIEKELTQR